MHKSLAPGLTDFELLMLDNIISPAILNFEISVCGNLLSGTNRGEKSMNYCSKTPKLKSTIFELNKLPDTLGYYKYDRH